MHDQLSLDEKKQWQHLVVVVLSASRVVAVLQLTPVSREKRESRSTFESLEKKVFSRSLLVFVYITSRGVSTQ